MLCNIVELVLYLVYLCYIPTCSMTIFYRYLILYRINLFVYTHIIIIILWSFINSFGMNIIIIFKLMIITDK